MNCCAPLRSNLKNVLPNGFFPAPYPLKRTPTGLGIPNPHEINGQDEFAPLMVRQMVNIKPANSVGLELPYDQYCPSVRSQTLGKPHAKTSTHNYAIQGVNSEMPLHSHHAKEMESLQFRIP